MAVDLYIQLPEDFEERYKNYKAKIFETQPQSPNNNVDYSDNAERKACEKKWDVLQTIWTAYKTSSKNDTIRVPIHRLEIEEKDRTRSDIEMILKGLEKDGCLGNSHRGTENYEIEGINHEKLEKIYEFTKSEYDKFTKTYQTSVHIQKNDPPETTDYNQSQLPEKFILSINDREIWINKWLLSKPHAVGRNMEIFEEIRRKPKELVRKSNLSEALKSKLEIKNLSKVFYELGFRGEILKAFFSKSGKTGYLYEGDNLKTKELEKRGIKIQKLIKELKMANLKNSPI